MKIVYKYAITRTDLGLVKMPVGARVVHVAEQHDAIMLWAEHDAIDENTEHVTRRFDVFGTGHSIPSAAEYVGTLLSGPYVWHIYEITTEDNG